MGGVVYGCWELIVWGKKNNNNLGGIGVIVGFLFWLFGWAMLITGVTAQMYLCDWGLWPKPKKKRKSYLLNSMDDMTNAL